MIRRTDALGNQQDWNGLVWQSSLPTSGSSFWLPADGRESWTCLWQPLSARRWRLQLPRAHPGVRSRGQPESHAIDGGDGHTSRHGGTNRLNEHQQRQHGHIEHRRRHRSDRDQRRNRDALLERQRVLVRVAVDVTHLHMGAGCPANGTKTVYAEFRDLAGNVFATSDDIVLDTVAPAVTIVTPQPYEVLSGNPYVISGTAFDSGSGLQSVGVSIRRHTDNWYWNGSDWTSAQIYNTASGTDSWTYGWNIPSGSSGATYTVRAVAWDRAGIRTSSPAMAQGLTVAGAPTTVYVSPTGSDAGAGTEASPFRTIAHALDRGDRRRHGQCCWRRLQRGRC